MNLFGIYNGDSGVISAQFKSFDNSSYTLTCDASTNTYTYNMLESYRSAIFICVGDYARWAEYFTSN